MGLIMTLQGLTKKEKLIFDKANEVLAKGVSASQFSQMFFSPNGELSALWTSDDEKKVVAESKLFVWLQQQLSNMRLSESQQFEKEVEKASGRLTITVPKSLHAALKREASGEGVSLSELIRLKLGYPYKTLTSLLTDEQYRPPQRTRF